MVTTATEDYIRAIYVLEQRGKPYLTDVASYLKLSKASASEMVKSLGKQGFIDYKPYSSLKLSRKGKNLAEKLTYKHRIIEVFLAKVIKLPENKIHEEAHKLEHAFSDESISRIKAILGNPKTDPHGQPIPKV